METLGQLTGGVAHDFNNLLAALLANLQLLSETKGLAASQRQYAERSLRIVQRGINLVERLMAFSRKRQLHPEVLEPDRLIAGMMDLIEYSIAPGIEIATDLKANESIYADPMQLENALLNLAINCNDAMPDGGRILFKTRKRPMPSSSVMCAVIVVEDTGQGIPLELQERILEPFFTTKAAGQGSGMGLSLVYGFVKQSGGEIQIESKPNVYSRVSLYFPIWTPSISPPGNETPPHILPVSIPEGRKVLLVEDNAEVRQALHEQIANLNKEVVSVESAETAYDLVKLQPARFALIVTDINLAGTSSGIDLKRQIGKEYPHIPVILISGIPREILERQFGLKTEDRLLAKPIPYSVLKRTIR